MSGRATGATAVRVLRGLRHDPRTIALLLVVPCVLLTILRYSLNDAGGLFTRIAPSMLGLFPLITMFLVTSVTMLRERTTGTLERLMTMPMGRMDLIAGYAIALALCTVAQVALVSVVAAGPLGLSVRGSLAGVAALALANALLGVALGLLVSAFATSEFQAVQFMPAVIFPQLLLCGLFAPRDTMASVLRWLSDVLPLTYAYDALARAATGTVDRDLAVDVAVTVGSALLAVGLAAATIRRRTD